MTRRLTAAQQLALVRRAQAGERRCRDILIRHTEPFCVVMARRLDPGRRCELDALVQAGRRGVDRAITRFKFGEGANFLSYAKWRIQAAIQYEMRVELATLAGQRSALNRALFARGAPAVQVVSLDAPLAGDALSLYELVPSGAGNVEADVAELEWRQRASAAIARVLAELPAREQAILRRRWLAGEPVSHRQLAPELGVSHQRVHQVESQLFRSLRGRPELQALAEAA